MAAVDRKPRGTAKDDFLAWIALLVLGAGQLAISHAHLGGYAIGVELVLAALMASVVLLAFMHLGRERFSVAMGFLAALFFIALLVSLVVVDVATRQTFPRTPIPFEPPNEEDRIGPPAGGR